MKNQKVTKLNLNSDQILPMKSKFIYNYAKTNCMVNCYWMARLKNIGFYRKVHQSPFATKD